MKRVVLVMELLEDEADTIVAAVTSTPVRFGGMPLSEIVEMMVAPTHQTDGTQISHIVSDGVSYQGLKPISWSIG